MNLLNWDQTKKIRLFINKVEMDFDTEFSFQDHTSNFSSMTFHNVIPKDKNNSIDIFKINDYGNEFQIGEVYVGDRLLFFGIVNATGRLSLFKKSLKTKSIQITDFRKWLSLKKPIDLLFFKVSPKKIVIDLINKLGEKRIIVGNLDFTNNENINAYSTFGKTPYQVLKEIIAKQTNSLLYFEITENSQISINYKSEQSLRNEKKLTIDFNDEKLFEDYKIINVELETNIDNYANVIKYESENVISNVLKYEELFISGSENIALLNNIGKIDSSERTHLINDKGDKVFPIIINEARYIQGQYYDIIYSIGKNSLKVNKKYLDKNYTLVINYYPKIKNNIQLINWDERFKVAQMSDTAGDVYKYEKFNDISNLDDLLRLCQGDLSISSNIDKNLIIECQKPIWNVGQTTNIKTHNPSIDGVYLVYAVKGNVLASSIENDQNFILQTFTYELRNSKNTNSLVNQFDNQSFKTNPALDENAIFETTENIDDINYITIESEYEIVEPSNDDLALQN